VEKGSYTCLSSCFKCNRGIAVEFYEDVFETEENTTFLGRLGTTTYTYCPYCGVKQSGFAPYDWNQKMDLSLEDDPAVPEDEEEDGEAWWPDAEGVTLIDEDEEDEEDPWDESEKEAFTCPSCGKKTRLNPKGCDRIFCYFCGKETERI
jgi:hypothetical protein